MIPYTVTVLKFGTLFSISSQIICWFFRAEIHKMIVSIANREDPDQTALNWFCAVCLGLFGRKLVFKILEHLL